jgi:Tol biopolymer transport system component
MRTSSGSCLLSLLLGLVPSSLGASQPIQLLTPSVSSPSITGVGDSTAPMLSGDGQLAVFLSTADDLTPQDGNGGQMDVFVRDRARSETALVSIALNGHSGNGPSRFAAISVNGRYVIFVSEADNLVEADTNGCADVFVRNLELGTTRLVSISTNGQSGNGVSGAPDISADGRWIVFESEASDLVADDAGGAGGKGNVFLFDQESGNVTRIDLPSSDPIVAQQPAGRSSRPRISADGSTVFFSGLGLDLAPAIHVGDLAHTNQLYAQRPLPSANRMIPIFPTDATVPVRLSPLGFSSSADGRHVAVEVMPTPIVDGFPQGIYWVDLDFGRFVQVAPNLNTSSIGTNPGLGGPYLSADGQTAVFEARTDLEDGTTRAVVWTWNVGNGETTRISSGGLTNAPGANPALSSETPFGELIGACPNIEFVAFLGGSPDDPPASMAGRQLMVRRLSTGELRRVSRTLLGGRVAIIDEPAVAFSADGKQLAFQYQGGDLIEHDLNEAFDVFLYDWDADVLELLSVRDSDQTSATAVGTSLPSPSGLSSDGRYLAYVSADSTLAGFNGLPNVFVRDLLTGSSQLVSVNATGTAPGNGASRSPVISADGRWIAFTSLASDLVAGDTNQVEDVFIRDIATSATIRAGRSAVESESTAAISRNPTLSPDGQWLAFEREGGVFDRSQIMLLDVASETVHLVSARASDGLPSQHPSISPRFSTDGRFLFFGSQAFGSQALDVVDIPLTVGWRAYAYEMATGQLRVLSADQPATRELAWLTDHPVASDAASRHVVFPRQNHLALHNVQTGAITAIATNAANPRMSADGRWLVYESNTAPEGVRQVLFTDLTVGQTTLVSSADGGDQPGNGHSTAPLVSADGQFVVFLSRATNLIQGIHPEATGLYLWDRMMRQTLLLSMGIEGNPASGLSYGPVLAADGRTLVFASFADNLVEKDRNRRADLFVVTLPESGSDFRIITITRAPAGPTTLIWAAEAGRTYQLEVAEDLSPDGWYHLDVPISIQDGQATAMDPTSAGPARRFYRIRVNP